jgi:hypothetical protein
MNGLPGQLRSLDLKDLKIEVVLGPVETVEKSWDHI